MRTFQSFLILFSICFNSGCSTFQKQKISEDPYLRIPSLYSPNYKYFERHVESLDPAGVFQYYCQNKKQIREYRLNVLVIFPRSNPGTSIDSAGIQINEYRKKVPRVLKEFINTSFKLTRPELQRFGNKVALVATNRNSKSIIEKFKVDQNYNIGNSEQAEVIYLEDQSHLVMNFMPSLLEREILYASEEAPGLFKDLYAPLTPSPFRESPYIPQESRSFKPEDIKYLSIITKKALTADSRKNNDKVFVITQVRNLEKVMLFDNYVLLIPKDLADEWEIHPKYKLHDENGALNLHQVVHLKEMLWAKVVDSQTKITESATQDSRVFKYEANLDLSLACMYARPIESLVTE